MIRRPPRSTLFPLHDALPISDRAGPIRAMGQGAEARRDRRAGAARGRARGAVERSEEHTSELQSRSDLVCRLLLEKKKKKKKTNARQSKCEHGTEEQPLHVCT